VKAAALFSLLVAMLAAAPANAQDSFDHAIGTDLFASTDAEDTSVIKAGLNLDLNYDDPEHYAGVRLERAWFKPSGQKWRDRNRIYVRAAGSAGDWKWTVNAGTDGDTAIGSASIHDESRFRKEFFVEREILETPQGLSRGIYYTFAGAAIDLPADDRNLVTLFAGLQEFTGDNFRTHVRANFVHVLKPEAGLSLQLRTRYFHDSDPHEFDYYSPRWYAQAVPVLQLRRFSHGWRYLVAAGVGVQRDSDSGWRRSSYFNAQVTSPPKSGWSGTAAVVFTETPSVTGRSYDYLQFTLGLRRAF
jgi:hypothetical protein